MLKIKNEIKKDYAYFIISTIATSAVTFLSSIIIAKSFMAEGVGVLAIVKLVPMICYVFLSFGIPTAGIFYIPKYKECSEIIKIQFVVCNFIVMFLIMICIFGFDFVHSYIYKNLNEKTSMAAIILIPLFFSNRFFENLFRGLGQNNKYSFVQLIRNALFLAGVIFVCYLSPKIEFIPVTLIISELPIYIYLNIYILKRIGKFRKINIVQARKMLIFGLKSQIGNVFAYLNVRFDQFVINSFLAIENLGIYSVAVNCSELIMLGPRAIGNANLSHASMDTTGTYVLYVMKLYKYIISLTALMFLISIPVYYYFVPFVFGEQFGNSSLLYIILLPGSLALSCNSILSTSLIGKGFPKYPSIANFLGCILTIGLNVTLIPVFGVLGASIASSCAYIIQSGITLIFFEKLLLRPARKMKKINAGLQVHE